MANQNNKHQNNKNSNNEKIAETHQLVGNKSIYSDAEIMNTAEQLFGVAEVIELLGRKAPLLMEDIITLNWYKIGIHVQEALQEYKYEMKQHYLTTKMGYDHFLVQEISNDMGRLNQEIQEFKYEIEHALQEVERLDQKIAQGFKDGIN